MHLYFKIYLFLLILYLISMEYLFYKKIVALFSPSSRRAFKYIFWGVAFFALIPLLFTLLTPVGFPRPNLETPLAIPYYLSVAWNASFLLLSPFLLIGKIIEKIEKKKVSSSKSISRKEFLSYTFYGSIPIFWSISTPLILKTSYKIDIEVNHIEIPIENLPPSLDGITLVHIADTHFGELIHKEHMKTYIKKLKDLPGDILIHTGDILNSSLYFLPIAEEFFLSLKEKYPLGIFTSLGNHDFIHNAKKLTYALSPYTKILRNDVFFLSLKRGEGIYLAGIDYAFRFLSPDRDRLKGAEKFYQKTRKKITQKAPVILLTHHPNDFLILKKYPEISLVLSGHTHGGQILLTGERDSIFSLGRYIYPYYKGYYYEEGKHLYVTSGLGHWFPLRIHCPFEIALIKLTRKPSEKSLKHKPAL